MTAFITNLCPNPSFEVSLAGYTAVDATVLSQTSENAVAGQFSMQVQTPGLLTGEGFYGPSAVFTSPVTGAVSVSLSGESGEVQVCAVSNPGGVVLASQTVQLTPQFQRVELDSLAIPDGELYLLVQTPSAQDLVFLVDAVQYEPESPASMYIDGDSYGCNWVGTPGLSASVMPAQNPVILIGGAHGDGFMNIIVPGSVSSFSASSGAVGGGSIDLSVGYPLGAFDDFAVFELTDPDPAQTYVSWNNANALSGQTAYNRNWMSVYPPLDYPVSDGSLLWHRAAFMAVGFEFESVPENVAQNVTEVQAETFPLGGNADTVTGPSNWDYPRALHTIIKPTRLNYAANPGFETDLSSWSAPGTASRTRVSSVSYGIEGFFDGQPIPQGNWSMLLTTTSTAAQAALLDVPFLFYGATYIFSAYVLLGTAPGVTLGLPYGGGTILSQGVDTTDPEWLRPWIVFQANASNIDVSVSTTAPGTLHVDDVLIEEGEVLGTYFDGSFNDPDYMWETGGVPGSTRSYWYEGFLVGQSVVTDILAEQLPLGISAAPPQFSVPPTQ